MDFALSEEQEMLRTVARDFLADAYPSPKALVREMERDEKGYSPEVWESMAELGWMGIAIPEEYGGMGLGVTGATIVGEELGRMPGLGSGIYAATMLGGVHQITDFGTEEQKSRFLTRIAGGELGAIALTEPFVGTDTAQIETTARRDGDRYIINGKKRFVTGAGVANRYMLYARTSDDPEVIGRNRHITGFMLEKGMPGFTIEKISELIGLENMHNGYLNMDDVTVPLENRIADEGQGWRVMMSGLNYERVICASLAIGSFREMLRSVVSYGQRRIQFDQPTINILTNQFKVADIIMELKLARLSTYYAAHLLDSGEQAAVESSICKLYGYDMLM